MSFLPVNFQIEYAWVSQEEITSSVTASDTTSYDLLLTTNIPDSFWVKSESTRGLEFTITNTNPMTNLEFDISEMLGHVDAFHFGKPIVKFGAAYQFSDTEPSPNGRLIHLPGIPSSSGKGIKERKRF